LRWLPNEDITPHRRSAQSLGLNVLPLLVAPMMVKLRVRRWSSLFLRVST
jgi:hypothetical protein